MKICLIDLPGIDQMVPNIGLGYLASSLMEKGHHVRVIDLNLNSKDVEKRLDESSHYDMVGISVKSFAIHSAIEVSRMIKSENLVWGGPHITVDGYNFLLRNEISGMGVVGEGEETLIEIADAIENNKGLQDIKGLIWRDEDRILVNPARGFSDDLDSLPYPNYEVFDSFEDTIAHYPLITSRGCPYSCIFCCAGAVSGKKYRARKPNEVIKELQFAKSKYYSSMFMVLDDNFTLDMSRAKEICRLLIEHRINMEWICANGIRADRLDDELAALMKQAGCSRVALGIESIDPEIFPTIKKSETLEDIRRAISICKKHSIGVIGFFIIGFPGDNLERVKSSVALVKKLGLFYTNWLHLAPYPKTEVWEWVNQNAKMTKNWEESPRKVFDEKQSFAFETDDFTQEERTYAYFLATVKCKCYDQLFDMSKPFLYNVVNMLRLIIKYDRRNILSHLLYALRGIDRVWRLYRIGNR